MSKDWLDVVTPFPGPTRCRPSQPPKRKNLYPNLSQYAANRAQTVQREPNGAFSCQQLRGEPERNHPFAKSLYELKLVPGVRIPPPPPPLNCHPCVGSLKPKAASSWKEFPFHRGGGLRGSFSEARGRQKKGA